MSRGQGSPPQPTEPRRRPSWRFRLFLLASLLGVAALGWASLRVEDLGASTGAQALADAATEAPSDTPAPALPSGDTSTPAPTLSAERGTLLYAAYQGGRLHLWAYVPGEPQPILLTQGPWNDRDPAVSPDGERLAFASDRDGGWDLYTLDLRTGGVRRLTETPGAEGNPTWSPDGRWIAYEAYSGGDYDIWILSVDAGDAPIQLTNQPALDHSPAWDPLGRRIAFISDRDGSADVFLADLDHPDERFTNLTRSPEWEESSPAFSPDGERLAYSARSAGIDLLSVQDMTDLARSAVQVGQGRAPAWTPDSRGLAAVLDTPLDSHIVSYALDGLNLVPLSLPSIKRLAGLSWMSGGLPGEVVLRAAGLASPDALYQRETATPISPLERTRLVRLASVSAPNPQLADTVDEAFDALRTRVAEEAGWDFLANLDNAFVGLNDPLPPGFAYNDWLYTGRAFAVSQAAFQAGWAEVAREDFGGQTYWRLFVRASRQDGSLGEPLRERPWNFSTRFTSDPLAYDQGGTRVSAIPEGYYVDFTELAAVYGFDRVPALSNWRTYFAGARYNEFALTDGLDWEAAMLEVYPASAVATPTPYRTPTQTPTNTATITPTPWWLRWWTPTYTRTPSSTPSPTGTSVFSTPTP